MPTVLEAPVETLNQKCELLRSLHVRGRPLVLPNAWDVATAKAVVAAGFPVVATTSAGVAAGLGFEDHQGAPSSEMLAMAERIARAVDVPVTVDAEAGYGMSPARLVDTLFESGAAGCNLEDTDHAGGGLVETERHAAWLAKVYAAAAARGYPLVINARIDVFLANRAAGPQSGHVEEAVSRARAYIAAGADCVYPIILHEREAVAAFVERVAAPVNMLALPQAPPIADLAEIGVARVSYGGILHGRMMRELASLLREIAG